jgi:hypothetical protein
VLTCVEETLFEWDGWMSDIVRVSLFSRISVYCMTFKVSISGKSDGVCWCGIMPEISYMPSHLVE